MGIITNFIQNYVFTCRSCVDKAFFTDYISFIRDKLDRELI